MEDCRPSLGEGGCLLSLGSNDVRLVFAEGESPTDMFDFELKRLGQACAELSLDVRFALNP